MNSQLYELSHEEVYASTFFKQNDQSEHSLGFHISFLTLLDGDCCFQDIVENIMIYV